MTTKDLNVKETLHQIDLLLYNAIRRQFVRLADREDLQQDVFIAVYTEVKRYDASRASWPTFLATIIQAEIHRFRLRKRWQKHRACESIHDLEDEDHPCSNTYPSTELNDIEQAVARSEIRQAIDELPKSLREICHMLLTLPKAQVAEALGEERYFVSKKLSTIRRLLAESNVVRDYL